ncbi:MAG TPA: Ig-like domain-containing protein [Mobilitalea sp.]|nr:Ig-like domain-containing protein [Mobilitalea sp.]
MSHIRKIFLSFLLCFSIISISLPIQSVTANAADSISFILLSQYKATADIGNEFYIIAITSNGKLPSWKSSNSSIASVNTYGEVTAKKAGTVTITAKITNAEASCKVTVNKTQITINKTSISIERSEALHLSASTSNQSQITWKSSKSSVATVDENGVVTGVKPGETMITANADGSTTACKVTVKQPTIKLSNTKIKLFRGQTAKLSATVSSNINPTWKTNKKSVALIDASGSITAVKHGSALITATVDGVSKTCEVVVEQPVIKLSSTELNLKKGSTASITASVSSGNIPVWSTSNPNIVTVDSSGTVTAVSVGRAYIYAAEDGIKIRCTVYITE